MEFHGVRIVSSEDTILFNIIRSLVNCKALRFDKYFHRRPGITRAEYSEFNFLDLRNQMSKFSWKMGRMYMGLTAIQRTTVTTCYHFIMLIDHRHDACPDWISFNPKSNVIKLFVSDTKEVIQMMLWEELENTA